MYLGTLNREDCAVKTVLEGSRREQARFLREIRLLENLRTSYITRYMGWSVCPEGFVLLMEYLPGMHPPRFFSMLRQHCLCYRYPLVHAIEEDWCILPGRRQHATA